MHHRHGLQHDTNDQRNCDRTEKSVARIPNGNILFQAADLLCCCNICFPSQELVSPLSPDTCDVFTPRCIRFSRITQGVPDANLKSHLFLTLTSPLDTFCDLLPVLPAPAEAILTPKNWKRIQMVQTVYLTSGAPINQAD